MVRLKKNQGKRGKRGKKPYTIQNYADAYRLAILYKFGGRYVDGDIIFLNSWPYIDRAEVTKENSNTINNHVLQFPPQHPCLWALMEDFVKKYDNCRWGAQGPLLFSRMMNNERCRGVFAHEPTKFSPLSHKELPNTSKESMRHLKSVGTIGLHLFNHVGGTHLNKTVQVLCTGYGI